MSLELCRAFVFVRDMHRVWLGIKVIPDLTLLSRVSRACIGTNALEECLRWNPSIVSCSLGNILELTDICRYLVLRHKMSFLSSPDSNCIICGSENKANYTGEPNFHPMSPSFRRSGVTAMTAGKVSEVRWWPRGHVTHSFVAFLFTHKRKFFHTLLYFSLSWVGVPLHAYPVYL